MELNNNPNKEFEYSGSTKKDYVGLMIFAIIMGSICFLLAYYYNTQFEAIERGEEVHIFKELYKIYSTFGKWAVLVLFLGPGIGMFVGAYSHYKKHVAAKKKEWQPSKKKEA
ncbi:hypothetical protein [Flavobacterium muglaense]|uniref:Uncharacterized protein n=1 Tax=Flavobacterium muglaense TaxID=2764716 RepID=A0A923SFT4_9FLAO|nr:hypothetical protein [Flavobacterium muglaense]MBC5838275.1 hypothetical protein [Flavobacterium muglaense]MBC5844810.1 hypothetical protein [Flavobacterium muglaense]